MRTVKVVIIGNSGVGKTTLRSQVRTFSCLSSEARLRIISAAIKFVSGQFSTVYRSTIGTDFITKTLPHYSKPDESVTLQIWVRNYPYPLSLLSNPIAHATIGYSRTRTLFIPFFCVFPWGGCRHPHFRRKSARDAARSQPLVVGVLYVQTPQR